MSRLAVTISNPHPYGPPVPCEQTDVHRIIFLVAREWGLRAGDILSDRRERWATLPRHVAMFLARKHTFCAHATIARAFAGRDHTTVLYAVRKIERLLEIDTALAKRVARIERDGKLPEQPCAEPVKFFAGVADDLMKDLRHARPGSKIHMKNTEDGK
jgi:hypothetical protein